MPVRPLRLSALAAFLTSVAGSALAVDLVSPDPDLEATIVEAPLVEPVGGWYLRGDLAYNFARSNNAFALASPASIDALEFELDEAFSLGAGIGYQINDNVRVDGTVSHLFKSEFDISFPCPGGAATCGSGLAVSDSVDVEVTTLMVNAYAEIGNYGGFTPYLGAGIGAAHMNYGTYTSDTSDLAGTPSAAATQRMSSGGDWRFAWAVHAGAGIDITEQLKLDLGYTFTRIENGEVAGSDATGLDSTSVHDDGLHSHAIRAGLRYHFN